MSELTRILSAIEQGDPSAAEQLLPLVYDELRQLAAHQAQVGRVDQGGRLQRLVGPFVGQLLGRQLAQLIVDQRQELFRRARRPARWRTGSG